jgi:hypothetical protein
VIRSAPRLAAPVALVCCIALGGVLTPESARAGEGAPTFHRIDVDSVSGAAFTVVGEVFPGERDIVTSGYGTLTNGVPSGGGTLQVYRPGANLLHWETVRVFGSDENIVFPNRPTIADLNGDGLNDLIVPSGYFFDNQPRGSITWWENRGLDAAGKARGFVRHDVLNGQGPAYHGVELVDLDGDGIRDLVTTAEAGGVADNQYDDTVRLEYLRGTGPGTFSAPVTLADGLGGSHPVVTDVDSDGRLDIVSSQYFNISYTQGDRASFLWFRQSGDRSAGLTSANFTPHTIATYAQAGFGFQIQPVVGFRQPGKVSWIGTNHQGRCFVKRVISPVMPSAINVPEMVMEFVPGADVTQPWTVKNLATPETTVADPTTCDAAFNVKDSPVAIHPTDYITARSAGGQAAPGVFGYGDLDGDGDVDLAVSGDGDRRLFWIEQRPGAAQDTVLHTLSAPGEQFGQSGGAAVEDLDGDGRPEVVFSSFDTSTVALWTTRTVTDPVVKPPTVTVRSYATRLAVTSPSKRPVAGRKATWKVRLTGAPGGSARKVTVSFRRTGATKARKVGVVMLKGGPSTAHAGRLVWRPKRNGVLILQYGGGTITRTSAEKAARTTVKVRLR